MTVESVSENVVLFAGTTVTTLVLFYAIGTDLLGADRHWSAIGFLVCLVVFSLVLVARYVRLRHLGVRLLFLRASAISSQDGRMYLVWLIGLALVGTYSVREVLVGEFLVGIVGCASSLLQMFVLTRGLIHPKRRFM